MQIAFLTLLPSILLSGFLFPREAMPKMIQLVGNILPVTYFIDILRGIILKGNTFDYLMYETFMLVVITLVLLTLAIKKFHKTLD
jgi:ABC-2 type transport system permease protein